MSPTHTRRNNRRYRYYVSQAVLQFRDQEAGSVMRVQAQSVEHIVSDGLKNPLGNSTQLMDITGARNLPPAHLQVFLSRATELAGKWDALSPHDQIEHLEHLSAA